MKSLSRLVLIVAFSLACFSLPAQNYKTDKVKKAVDVLGLQIVADSLLPDTTMSMVTKDGRTDCLRINPMGEIEHIGIPLFSCL